MNTLCRRLVTGAVTVMALTAPAAADSTNAEPVITWTTTPQDVASLPWITPETRTVLQGYETRFRAGEFNSWVVALSPSGHYGNRNATKAAYFPSSIRDEARGALEECEFFYGMPCYLAIINGMSTRDANGQWAEQPYMLDPAPAQVDYSSIPFAPEVDRRALRSYQVAASPKALAMATSGYWVWKNGATALEAITAALNECNQATGNSCALYAVGNMVVMDFAR